MISDKPVVSIIAAAAENNVIGRDNDMPWRLSSDLKRFKALTLGKPVIMGRRTWESLSRPLPGRANIVITQNRDFAAEGALIVHSLAQALDLANELARESGSDEIFIIGGGKIYTQALPLADRIYLTRVLAQVEGDTYFPQIDSTHWRAVSSENVPAGEKDSYPTCYIQYQRQTG